MEATFTAHNIRLDDGECTISDTQPTMDQHPWFLATKRVLDLAFPGDKSQYRIADLGCLEGGYTVEFARLGFQSVGIEIRDSNIAACNYVKSRVALDNLDFIQDNAMNVADHGPFDAVFCCGLLYHLDQPKAFLESVASVTNRVLVLQTHFSVPDTDVLCDAEQDPPAGRISNFIKPQRKKFRGETVFDLSPIQQNEGLPGRWFAEFTTDDEFKDRDARRWASWDNLNSFWVQREYLLQTIKDIGFDAVFEQFDGLGDDIAGSMTSGVYHRTLRGTFIGVKDR